MYLSQVDIYEILVLGVFGRTHTSAIDGELPWVVFTFIAPVSFLSSPCFQNCIVFEKVSFIAIALSDKGSE